MKILRISLRNLASIAGTHTVDFTREPLRSSGLFSISGPTGSGKSTLLDALCLALYERTPRLNGIRSAVRLADGGHGETITQKDPGNLLRRGTGEGFAEVAFVGIDNETYTARWIVRRGRNKADGALQNTEMALFRGNVAPGTNGPLELSGRKTEVLPVIKEKLGLTFEQFTRAVLLAQNDFATFLKADDKERAEILQALTGTERFEEISRRVFARSSKEQDLVDQIDARLAGNAPLTPEAREQAMADHADAEKALKSVIESVLANEAKLGWFTRLKELTATRERAQLVLNESIGARENATGRRLDLEQTEKASREARSLRESERSAIAALSAEKKLQANALESARCAELALEEKRRLQAESEAARVRAQEARECAAPQLLQARDLDARLVPVAQRLEKAQGEALTAQAAFDSAIKERDTLRAKQDQQITERDTLGIERQALSSFAPLAGDATAWLDRLDRSTTANQAVALAQAQVALRVSAENENLRLIALESDKEPALRSAAEAARSALEAAESAAKVHDGEKIAAARQASEGARSALQTLKVQLGEVHRFAQQARALELEISKAQNENQLEGAHLAELSEKTLPLAEAAFAAACEGYDQAKAAVDAATVALREALRPEVPCPVCGAKEHPYTAHPPSAEAIALRTLKSLAAQKEKVRDELRREATKLEANLQSRAIQLSEKRKTRAELLGEIELRRAVSHSHDEAVLLCELPEEARLPALEIRLQELATSQAELEAAESARRLADQQREQKRREHEKAAHALSALEKRLVELQAALGLARAGREAGQLALSREIALQAEQIKALEPLFVQLHAEAAFAEDATAFRNSFARSTSAFLHLEKRDRELTGAIAQGAAALAPSEVALKKAEAELEARRTEESNAAKDHQQLLAQRKGLLGGRPAQAVEDELATALAGAINLVNARAAEFGEAGKLHAARAQALKGAEMAYVQAADRQLKAAQALDAWLVGFSATHRLLDRDGLDLLLARSEAWFLAERAALAQLEKAVVSAEGALAVHEATLLQHSAIRPTTDEEPSVVAALTAARVLKGEAMVRCDGTRAILHSDDRRIQESAQLNNELVRQRSAADPWLKLNELIGSADGGKFRGIAQRRTLDILLGFANAQLCQLAARYRLERLPESLNLIVIDGEMGDERRSVHSLSGGESFLVSLALALALASLTSNRLRIESLFIDEGFGSLDPETLETAMGALMHLEAQGRKVGVISHVAEMTDAIPVQIRVVKGRSGASHLLVPGAPPLPEPEPISELDSEAIAETGARSSKLLLILQRERALGQAKVSIRALCKEIGCDPTQLHAAHAALSGQVTLEGRSFTLAPEPTAA